LYLRGNEPGERPQRTVERRSLRKIGGELETAGWLNGRGRPYNPNSMKLMLGG
jgi:hypothetical protein